MTNVVNKVYDLIKNYTDEIYKILNMKRSLIK